VPLVAPATAARLGLALAACALALGACHGADAYYRTGDASATSIAGSSGAAGTGASGLTGAAGGAGLCTSCAVEVIYTCRSDRDDDKQASFVVEVNNVSNAPIALSDLTLRYWYTADQGQAQWLDCDFAELGCSNVTSSGNKAPDPTPRFVTVTPPRNRANTYVEIGFSPGALTLDRLLGTGEIQLRLHNQIATNPIMQANDYSFDDAQKGNPVPWMRITAYLRGVLVWGTEPPP
jgi:hypothetical protein